MVRIVIADTHPFIVRGLQDFLEDNPEIEIVGTALNGQEALEKIETLQPDIIILGCELQGVSGVEVAVYIRVQGWPVRVLALSPSCEWKWIQGMLDAGVSGILLKTDPVEEMALAIRSIARGGKWFSQMVWNLIVQRELPQPQAAQEEEEEEEEEEEKEKLTVKQREILQRVALGRTDAQIAVELRVTTKAINKQLGRVFERLGAHNRAHAVYLATKRGLI